MISVDTLTELEKEGQSQLFFFKTEQELINNKMKTIKIKYFCLFII